MRRWKLAIYHVPILKTMEERGQRLKKKIVTLYPKNNSKVCLDDHTTLSFINGYINILLLL